MMVAALLPLEKFLYLLFLDLSNSFVIFISTDIDYDEDIYMKRLLLFLLIAVGFGANAQTTNYTALGGPNGGSPQKIISNTNGDLLAVRNGLGVYKSADG